ncbi:MAG: MogA/MoaB family molybdenum cofactor biosynthesis protein [Deltaproteobacteria bacterium]|jgi:molybdenum cofactor synthesis domain-containing protein|nr:MogA/MoaB family molybdenum cofactor biosynthesis protein [Deltaproteobacteria bacterium]
MLLSLIAAECARGGSLPLAWAALAGVPAHRAALRPLPALPVGTELCAGEEALFKVTGRGIFPAAQGPHALECPFLTALRPVQEGESLSLSLRRAGYALAWITLSDKGFAGLREDESGPLVAAMTAEKLALCHSQGFLLPDEEQALRALFVELALAQGYELVIATGGTGLAPRDRSPEAALSVIERRLPGFEQAMMAAGLQKTPTAALSRAVAGTLGRSIVICLPGSRKAVAENLAAVLPALAHALDKLKGDAGDCGGVL